MAGAVRRCVPGVDGRDQCRIWGRGGDSLPPGSRASLEMQALFKALAHKVTRFHVEAEERALA